MLSATAREHASPPLIDLLPTIVLVIGTDGRIVRANREAHERLAGSDTPLVGRTLESTFGEPNLFDVLTFESLFLQGPTREMVVVFNGDDGETITCSANTQVAVYDGAPHVILVGHSSGELHDALASTARWAANEQGKADTLRRAQWELAQKNQELRDAQQRISETSRIAGMAEIATGILHNVGNVLNSVNVSADLLADRVRKSRVIGLTKVVDLLQSQTDVHTFLAEDPRGKKVLPYLFELANHIELERAEIDAEVEALQERVDRIKSIVAKQQRFAKVTSVIECCEPTKLVSEALELVEEMMRHHDVEIVRDEADLPACLLDRHRFVQILVNLLTNAKNAVDDMGPAGDARIIVRSRRVGDARFAVTVEDSGVGIPPDVLDEVFKHGFTTRKDGHGFGLHDSANAATELGGSLSCASQGRGRGAAFTLELPIDLPASSGA